MSNPPPRRRMANPIAEVDGKTVVISGGISQSYGFQKMGQLWLWGIALAAIWGGLFTIAFAQGDSNNRFAMLAIGGLLSASLFFGIVDLQRRKHGIVTDLHDYMLAMSFFFAAAGLFWGIRYGVALLASADFNYFVDANRPFTSMDATGWYPNANTIYAQTAGAALLSAMQWLYLKPMESDSRNMNTVSWFVACITPFALLLVGLGTWVNWSNGFVSYEIGISLVMLSAIAMMLSIESNNGLVFAITANVASFLTLIYEIMHDPPSGSTSGGALSLMTFIIIAQGLLAASPRLDRKLVEKASIGLIVAAITAMLYAADGGMTLHLGPFKFGPENTYLTLPTMIWITILVSYFVAVLDNRIPWMPIGLAASLVLLPNPSNVIPWSICLIMIPYMLWNKKTREWVANWTFGFFALSFFTVGWMTWADGSDALSSFPKNFDMIIAMVIIASGEAASRNDKLNRNVFRFSLFCVVGSPATLVSDNSLMPWIVALYLLGSVIIEQMEFKEKGDFDSRKDMSLTMATSLSLTVLLASLDRLSLKDTPLAELESQLMGFNLLIALIAVAYFAIGYRLSKSEFDIGMLLAMMTSQAERSATFNPDEQNWVVESEDVDHNTKIMDSSWGQIARFSLLGPLFLFSVAIASTNQVDLDKAPYFILLFAIPVGALVNEVLKAEGPGSVNRAVAVWSMFVISIPITGLLSNGIASSNVLNTATLMFDLILIGGPLTVHFVLLNRGLAPREDLSKLADEMTLLGLLFLGLLDATGGLALTVLFAIVLWRAILHRSILAIYALPLVWLFFPDRWTNPDGFIHVVLEPLGGIGEWLTESVGGFLEIDTTIRFTGLMLVLYAALALSKSATDVRLRKLNPELEINKLPFVYPGIMLFFGLNILLVDDAWLLCVVTTILLLFGWGAGRMEGFAFAPYAYFLSFLTGFGSTYSDLNEFELLSLTCFASGLVTFALWISSHLGYLYKCAKDVITLEELQEQSQHPSMIIKQPSMIRCSTQEGRDRLSQSLRLTGMVLLLCAFDEIYGLSTLFVAIWVTWDAWHKQERTLFLLTPLMHAIAMWNISRVAEIQDYDLAGWLLIIEGSILTYLSLTKWYPDWDWGEDGDDYWAWNDMMGIFGAAYGVAGILWALWGLSELGAAMLVIIYCGLQAAANFENSWRRITSLVGTSIGTFMVLLSNVETTFKGIALIVGGLAAFAQAVLYFRLWGVEEDAVKIDTTQSSIIEIEKTDEEEISEESADVPETVTTETDEELDEEELDEILSEIGELDEQPEEEEVSAEQVDRVSTNMGFEIVLPTEVIGNINDVLNQTDFEGFKPVVSFDQFGQIVLSFEPSSS